MQAFRVNLFLHLTIHLGFWLCKGLAMLLCQVGLCDRAVIVALHNYADFLLTVGIGTRFLGV